jgi:hypothetical protein
MKRLLGVLATACALGASQLAGAAVVNFDSPALIDIDNDSGRAVYREAGFALSGEAAGFLTIDGLGSAMTGALVLLDGSTVSLMANDGGLFSFAGLAAGSLDTQGSATLRVTGIFGDSSQLSALLALSQLDTVSAPMWTGLTELRFMADGDLVIDDLRLDAGEVPEPASVALLLLGIGVLVGVRRTARAGTAGLAA